MRFIEELIITEIISVLSPANVIYLKRTNQENPIKAETDHRLFTITLLALLTFSAIVQMFVLLLLIKDTLWIESVTIVLFSFEWRVFLESWHGLKTFIRNVNLFVCPKIFAAYFYRVFVFLWNLNTPIYFGNSSSINLFRFLVMVTKLPGLSDEKQVLSYFAIIEALRPNTKRRHYQNQGIRN